MHHEDSEPVRAPGREERSVPGEEAVGRTRCGGEKFASEGTVSSPVPGTFPVVGASSESRAFVSP